jgi:hypothetical protein
MRRRRVPAAAVASPSTAAENREAAVRYDPRRRLRSSNVLAVAAYRFPEHEIYFGLLRGYLEPEIRAQLLALDARHVEPRFFGLERPGEPGNRRGTRIPLRIE